MIDLRLGDCLEVMPTLSDASFDAIIADIPYGTTACKWDTVIPFAPMWAELKRLAKPKAAIVLFGSQPFTSALIMSNPKMFRYEWIWEKSRPTGFQMSAHRPMKKHENVVVFSFLPATHTNSESMTYSPQGVLSVNRVIKRTSRHNTTTSGGELGSIVNSTKANLPNSILRIQNDNNDCELHPTQKPVALMEYLVKTYTNEGDTVLDFTMGSGTTLVACINTNRNGVGVEKEPEYFEIAQRRVKEAQVQMTMELA